MLLSELKVGETAKIVDLNAIEPSMRKKLFNLGLLPKATIKLLSVAPMGDPLAIRCLNSTIALRKNVAHQITVEY